MKLNQAVSLRLAELMQQEKEKCENGKISMDEFIQWLKES